jgi:hypothetical protein
VLGGVLFMVAGWAYLRRYDRRSGLVFSVLGVLGGLGASVAMLLLGIG